MIESLTIRGLRGIKEGTVSGLAPLTVFVGPNGCGKSTVLEAAGVACAGPNTVAAIDALATREWLGLNGIETWLSPLVVGSHHVVAKWRPLGRTANQIENRETATQLLRQGPTEFSARLHGSLSYCECAVDDDGVISVTRNPTDSFFPFTLHRAFVDRPAGARKRFTAEHFSSALRDAIGRIKLSPWYDDLLGYLRVLRPEIQSIESIPVGDRDEPFVFVGPPRQGFPLAYAGDGFRRALLIASSLAEAKGGVCALDEPEAFSHPRMFDVLTQLFQHAIADGTQILIATHSLEFLRAIVRTMENEPSKVSVVGMTMAEGKLDSMVVTGPDVLRRVVEMGDDLRL